MGFLTKISGLGFESKNHRIIAKSILMLFFLFLSIYITTSLLAPIKRLRELNKLTIPITSEDSITYSLLNKSSKLDSLTKEEAFLKSRLTMSKTDSIGIVIDIHDSTIRLELHGVTIHTSKISLFKVDRFFNALDNQTFKNLFSVPFSTILQTSSIEKEPVTIKNAPKDTIEAAKSVFIPDTSLVPPMFCSMELNTGIELFIVQDTIRNKKDWFEKNRFYQQYKTKDFLKNWNSLFHLQIPYYKPAIILYLPQKDAIAIYRALPSNALICMRL